MKIYIGQGGYHPELGQLEHGQEIDETKLSAATLEAFSTLLVDEVQTIPKGA